MTSEDIISDVHLYTTNELLCEKDENQSQSSHADSYKWHLSRFNFIVPHPVTGSCQPLVDSDDDLDVKRDVSQHYFVLEHSIATSLDLVGLQVWNGALLLCDFLFYAGYKLLSNQVVLELGSGAGLCSLLASKWAQAVIATDVGDPLELCLRNVHRNRELVPELCPIIVRELDWSTVPTAGLSDKPVWGWSHEDIELLKKVSIILASDVIYSNQISSQLLQTVDWLSCSTNAHTVYIALEKRINFCFDNMKEESPFYDFFFRQLRANYSHWKIVQCPLQFPCCSSLYSRSQYMELWRLDLKARSEMETSPSIEP